MKNLNNRITVAVLMATYNGEKYIKEQLDSILNQKSVNVVLYVRDDGSTDKTVEILRSYESKNKLYLFTGENYGPAKNFFELLRICDDADYFAWADQDDIWDEDKLVAAVSRLELIDSNYKLYWCQHRILSEGVIKASKENSKPSLTFSQALLRSVAQGSTMVFNQPLRDLVRKQYPDFKKLNLYHDAWLHKVCLAVGGVGYFDKEPHITYRIHGENVFAKNNVQKPNKIKDWIKKQFGSNAVKNYYSGVASELLKYYSDLMPEENLHLAMCLANYKTNLFYRLKIMFSNEFKRNSIKADLQFILKCIMNRV